MAQYFIDSLVIWSHLSCIQQKIINFYKFSKRNQPTRGALQQKEMKACTYLPNCQTNLVYTLHALSPLFWHFINTTVFHFDRYLPSSPSTKEAPCSDCGGTLTYLIWQLLHLRRPNCSVASANYNAKIKPLFDFLSCQIFSFCYYERARVEKFLKIMHISRLISCQLANFETTSKSQRFGRKGNFKTQTFF